VIYSLIAATVMTLSVLEGLSLIANLFKCDISYLWRVTWSLWWQQERRWALLCDVVVNWS